MTLGLTYETGQSGQRESNPHDYIGYILFSVRSFFPRIFQFSFCFFPDLPTLPDTHDRDDREFFFNQKASGEKPVAPFVSIPLWLTSTNALALRSGGLNTLT
jgi:hypothetical protein